MEAITDISEIIRNIGLVVAAAIALPLAIWRSYIAHKQGQIAADNHLAETYTKAIDQIGEDKEAIQLGGLYALEKIALKNHEYHGQVIEVLCAYVRLHAPRPAENTKEDRTAMRITTQAALTIIGRRKVEFDMGPDGETKIAINLSGTNLYGANLHEADLTGADLREAFLRGADLRKADLRWTFLRGANLTAANLQEANLHRGNLTGADLHGTNLTEADLREAVITQKQINSALTNERTVVPKGLINPSASPPPA